MTDERFGWEEWAWDETLFADAAPHYRRGRLPYALGVPDALAATLHLDGTGRLLDVGCGPGVVALLLRDLFEEVVGVDPDAAMLDEARRAADELGATNARWVQRRAEELPADLGTFRVATFAQSFHWMDRPLVAGLVRRVLEPHGAVVQVDAWRDGDPVATTVPPHPPVPHQAIGELRVRWLGPDRRAGQGLRNSSPSGEDAVFQAAGFLPEERVAVPDGRVLERSVDDVVATVLSMSSTAPHLFGDRLPAFVEELRALVVEASPSGRFSVALGDTVLRVRRLPS